MSFPEFGIDNGFCKVSNLDYIIDGKQIIIDGEKICWVPKTTLLVAIRSEKIR